MEPVIHRLTGYRKEDSVLNAVLEVHKDSWTSRWSTQKGHFILFGINWYFTKIIKLVIFILQ